MAEWCWLNGQIMPINEARVGVEDRGFLFADGVYEALRLYNGKPFGLEAHLDRLERSCGGIRLPMPLTKSTLINEITKLVAHSGVREGLVYLQATRGPAGARNHLFPATMTPTVFFFVRQLPPPVSPEDVKPYTLLSVPDERWQRCWIKSIALLPNVLAKNAAAAAGADEAVFIDNGNVTECASTNLFMVIGGHLVTHPLGPKILPGVTRDIVTDCARHLGIPLEERAVKLEDAKRAAEVFVTSSTRELVWVFRWDDTEIGNGAIGPLSLQLHTEYRQRVAAACEQS
jgi:D-alanine transaminase